MIRHPSIPATIDRSIWLADIRKFEEALKPWVFEIDGQEFLRLEAPRGLTRPYAALRSIGYANGFYPYSDQGRDHA